MKIPRYWAQTRGETTTQEGRPYAFRLWGWSSESRADAFAMAQTRLSTVLRRIARGEPLQTYAYGRLPLREEIIEEIGSPDASTHAMVTRNAYGVLVLNTARVPFIDIDVPAEPASAFSGLRRWFGGGAADPPPALARIRAACARHPLTAFRIYRTAAGYRVVATNVLLDPHEAQAQAMLTDFAADPSFVTLCRIQRSFRARLTPKPWRCGCKPPPGTHPREDDETRAAFAAWLAHYDSARAGFATCRFIEDAGPSGPRPPDIIALHDRLCQATSDLPLA